MKESIYTIPINEVFDAREGCPLCALKRKLETDSVDYIVGAAMMEPDVRIKTNRLGFCAKHYDMMLSRQRALSLALTLESRLGELLNAIDSSHRVLSHSPDPVKVSQSLGDLSGHCYICERIREFEEHYYENIIFMWQKEPDFREKLKSQPFFCLEHAAGLLQRGQKSMSKRNYPDFGNAIIEMEKKYIESLKNDVSGFCKSFDYRNTGRPLTESEKSASSRAIEFLSGEMPKQQ